MLRGSNPLLAPRTLPHIIGIQRLLPCKLGKGRCHAIQMLLGHLQRQVQKGIVGVGLVLAGGAGTSELAAVVAAEDAVDEGGFVEAGDGETVAPSAGVGVDAWMVYAFVDLRNG